MNKLINVLCLLAISVVVGTAGELVPKSVPGIDTIFHKGEGWSASCSQGKHGWVYAITLPSEGTTAQLALRADKPGKFEVRAAMDNGIPLDASIAEKDEIIRVIHGAVYPFTLYVKVHGEEHKFPFLIRD